MPVLNRGANPVEPRICPTCEGSTATAAHTIRSVAGVTGDLSATHLHHPGMGAVVPIPPHFVRAALGPMDLDRSTVGAPSRLNSYTGWMYSSSDTLTEDPTGNEPFKADRIAPKWFRVDAG